MRREHAMTLLQRGKMRIGTLLGYRDVGQHGTAIGDSDEGVKSLHLDGTGERWDASSIPEFAKAFFNLGPKASLQLDGIRLVMPQQSPDYYLFCASEVADPVAMAEFGYNACVVIERPDRFFPAISHALRHVGVLEAVERCQYLPRSTPHHQDHGVHPALLKEPAYAYQKEVRALWRPIGGPPRPRFIECRKAAKWCSPGLGL